MDLRQLNGDADLVAELQRRGRRVFEGGLSVFLDLLEQDIHERQKMRTILSDGA